MLIEGIRGMRNSLLLPIATVVMAIVGVSHSVQAESEACMIPLIPSSAAGFASGPLERIIRESYLRPCGSVLTSSIMRISFVVWRHAIEGGAMSAAGSSIFSASTGLTWN